MVQATKAEKTLSIDKKTLAEVIDTVFEGAKKGLSKKRIIESIELLIDEESQKAVEEGRREVRDGKTKSFDDVEEAVAWLKSGRD